jgi:hypothetical protein
MAAAAVLFVALSGRILGVGGMPLGLLPARRRASRWLLAFVGGLVVGAFVARELISGGAAIHVATPVPRLLAAVILVGLGASLGNGYAGGQGTYRRWSRWPLMAPAVFLTTAVLTAVIVWQVAAVL